MVDRENKRGICRSNSNVEKIIHRLTAVCKNGGFRLNLKLVLYLQSLCLTESLGFLNPPLLQAAKRWATLYQTDRK